jgi:hypothetical protein
MGMLEQSFVWHIRKKQDCRGKRPREYDPPENSDMSGRLFTFITPDYLLPTVIRHTEHERKINWNSFITEMCNLRAAMSWAALFLYFTLPQSKERGKNNRYMVIFTPLLNLTRTKRTNFTYASSRLQCFFRSCAGNLCCPL